MKHNLIFLLIIFNFYLVFPAYGRTIDSGSITDLKTILTTQVTCPITLKFLTVSKTYTVRNYDYLVDDSSSNTVADFSQIQDAINAASDGDVIVVCPGTYNENLNIDKGVTIIGAAGHSSTVIDGQSTGSVVTTSRYDPISLSGFTLQNGRSSEGGGVYHNSFDSLTLDDVWLEDNYASDSGGGLFNSSYDPVTITDSAFLNNTADGGNPSNTTSDGGDPAYGGSPYNTGHGGGIYNQSSEITLENVSFENNIAYDDGGGYYGSMETITMTNGTFTGNQAIRGYGGAIYESGDGTISNSTFEDNTAGDDGGAIYAEDLTLSNVSFTANHADRDGGAIASNGGMTLTDVEFTSNSADDDGGAYASSGFTVDTLNSVSFTTNIAARDGGALYLSNETTMQDCSVTSNTAGRGGGGLWSGMFALATISTSTFTSNSAGADGGGIAATDMNGGPLSLDSVTISSNGAGDEGGGLWSGQDTTITNSTINSNSASQGGGVHHDGNTFTTFTMTNTAVSNNSATSHGGGIYFNYSDPAVVENSTINNNGATRDGAGVYVGEGTLNIKNSTIANNTSDHWGGAIYTGSGGWSGGGAIAGETTLDFVTLSLNMAQRASGIFNEDSSSSQTEIKNIIIQNYTTLPSLTNCIGTITSLGYNIEDGRSCDLTSTGDLQNTDPLLDSAGLANNGGSTQTVALQSTSPAINAGDCTAIDGTVISTDQRGTSRPQGSTCDIGAYEY